LHQKDLSSEIFIKKIKELLNNDNLRSSLSKNIAQVIPNANQVMVDIIEELI
jgi:UDP-N-acetylglucosamine:LPS N-acetylglucosamine transferase